MDDLDTMLVRLAGARTPRPLSADPTFVARLEASAARGEVLGALRSVAVGLAAAGLMVAMQPRPMLGGAGFLLATASGEAL